MLLILCLQKCLEASLESKQDFLRFYLEINIFYYIKITDITIDNKFGIIFHKLLIKALSDIVKLTLRCYCFISHVPQAHLTITTFSPSWSRPTLFDCLCGSIQNSMACFFWTIIEPLLQCRLPLPGPSWRGCELMPGGGGQPSLHPSWRNEALDTTWSHMYHLK